MGGRSWAARRFDDLAMASFPWLARAWGLRFETGTAPRLADEGRAVLREVWSRVGVVVPPEAAAYGARYDDATVWIIARHRGRPVGVMGLVDVSRASIALELGRRVLPSDLDPARTREIARLAILPAWRGGAQIVMVGLLREMLRWSLDHGVVHLIGGAAPALFGVYARFNPTARLLDAPADPEPEPAERAAYFAPIRAVEKGRGVLFSFLVRGALPWDVFSRFLRSLAPSQAADLRPDLRTDEPRSTP